MKKLLCLFLVAAGVASSAEAPQAELMRRLHEPAVLRGTFVQSRQIVGFKRPVGSTGSFVVARGTGLLWHTHQPFESLLSVNRERLRVSNGAGRPDVTLDARQEPMLRTLNDLLQSVVVADIAKLEAQFAMEVRLVGPKDWELTLRPKDAGLRGRISAIELSGGPHVESVRISEQSGDVTTVRFTQQIEDVQLTNAEAEKLR